MTDDSIDPIPEPGAPAPTGGVIVALNRDLMFGALIRNAARALGYGVVFTRDAERFVDAIRERTPPPVLAVVDMNGPLDWGPIKAATADPAVPTPFLGFGPHVDIEGRRAAKAAGLDRIVANGEFHRDPVGLLRRYARPASTPS